MNAYYSLAALIFVSGCASIISGTTQDVAVNSIPSNALCTITQDGIRIQQVVTPASMIVQRTKHDLLVSCARTGFLEASAPDKSGIEPWVFGNLLIGGIVGVIVDLSTGAQNKYDSPVNVVLPPRLQPPFAGQSNIPPVT